MTTSSGTPPLFFGDGITQDPDTGVITYAVVALTPDGTTPGALGYGTDLACVDDIDASASEIDPASTLGLAQDLYHRLSTPRGTLVDDADYGIDLRSFLSVGQTPAQIQSVQGQIVNEASKDDRLDTVDAVATYGAGTLAVSVRATPKDPRLAAFTLVISVTSGSILLAAIEA